jgi:DNA-binding CsgD family transcriptional regulator
MLACAGWLIDTGEFASARTRVEPLLAADVRAAIRSQALLLRAECELSDRHHLISLLRQAHTTADQPRTRWQALIRLAQHAGWVSGDAARAASAAREALDVALSLDDGLLVDYSLAALAFYESARGRPDTVPNVPSTGRHGSLPRMQWWLISPAISLGCRLLWAGSLSEARQAFTAEHESLRQAGYETRAGFVLCWLSELEWRAGEWERAAALAREATEILGDINPTAFPRALLAASAGRADEACATADGALAWSRTSDERTAPPRFLWLLGLLELSRGEPELARHLLLKAQELLDAAGITEPGYLPVLPDLIESLVASAQPDQARPLLARLEDYAARSGQPWTELAALRSRAVISLSQGDTDAACTMSDEVASRYQSIGMPLDRGRALLLAGEARRRLGQRLEAAQRISTAVTVFEQLGAPLWLDRARRELRRASPRPGRAHDQLTAAEAQVAELVASGRTNKEVAAALYTSVATVEAHLTRIYRKLGLRSRSELARQMAQGSAHDGPQQQSGFP